MFLDLIITHRPCRRTSCHFVSKTYDFTLNFLKIEKLRDYLRRIVFFLLCSRNVENCVWSDKFKACYEGEFKQLHQWQITAEERNFFIPSNFLRVAQSYMNKNSIKIMLDWTLDWCEKYQYELMVFLNTYYYIYILYVILSIHIDRYGNKYGSVCMD